MIKDILYRWFMRMLLSLLVIGFLVAYIVEKQMDDSWMLDICVLCLIGAILCAIAGWPRKRERIENEPTQKMPTIAMPPVPEPVTQAVAAIDIRRTYREAVAAAFEDDDGYWDDEVEV